MNHAESWILAYLLNSLWQVPLLCCAGWVAARAMRRCGVAAEHRAWVSVLVLQVVIPALPTVPERWVYPMLAWMNRPAPAPVDGTVTVEFSAVTAHGGFHLPPWFITTSAVACLAITLYLFARLLWRLLRLSSIRRASRDMDLTASQATSLAGALRSFGVEDVSLCISDELRVPVTLGIARNVILLPAALVPALSDTDFCSILEHELAHIQRRDFARNLFYELLSLPIAYHPALRITRERIAETREMVCDRIAADHAGALEYGRSLLRIASLLVTGLPARSIPAIGIFDSRSLERRLMQLKDHPHATQGILRAGLIATCVLFALATCASALTLHLGVLTPIAASGAAAKSSQPLQVPARDAQAHIVTKVPPQYPPDAKKARIQGTVVLRAVITKQGDIDHLSVVSGPKELQKSALDAVRQWKYKPFLLNGQPTEVETEINVIYRLAKK